MANEQETPELRRMQPIVILPTGQMDADNIAVLRANGICVVECVNPDEVKFIEPPPMGYERCEWAALELSRFLLNADGVRNRREIAEIYVHFLIEGTRLDTKRPSPPAPVEKIQATVPKRGRPRKATPTT